VETINIRIPEDGEGTFSETSVRNSATLYKATEDIYNVHLPQQEDIKYLGLHIDRRLTWRKHMFTERKQLGMTLTKMLWLLGRKSKLSTGNSILIYKGMLKPIWTYNTTVGYGFHFKHRNPRTLPI
jgi:hypothetical protein